MDMTLWDAEQQQQGGISAWPWVPQIPVASLPISWRKTHPVWVVVFLLEGYHHSSFKLEAEQATGWMEGGWRVGNFRNSDELWAAPRAEFCSTHRSTFLPPPFY